MGALTSQPETKNSNLTSILTTLNRLCGPESIGIGSNFWYEDIHELACELQIIGEELDELEEKMIKLCELFVKNDVSTHNLMHLLTHLAQVLELILSSNDLSVLSSSNNKWKLNIPKQLNMSYTTLINLLLITRAFLKYFIEVVPLEELYVTHFSAPAMSSSGTYTSSVRDANDESPKVLLSLTHGVMSWITQLLRYHQSGSSIRADETMRKKHEEIEDTKKKNEEEEEDEEEEGEKEEEEEDKLLHVHVLSAPAAEATEKSTLTPQLGCKEHSTSHTVEVVLTGSMIEDLHLEFTCLWLCMTSTQLFVPPDSERLTPFQTIHPFIHALLYVMPSTTYTDTFVRSSLMFISRQSLQFAKISL
ncbi:hypothetical protein RFI_23314 [Reticulomyxa filosa]|uniref:Dymeclin n=1 Tax=Reticulomyxa filosa TaxID=46433 RepID=X6MJM4_RETFI|nr:hypothetical protein RFI_23314 [Reticulomyxa filosa]|eukprot:ETO14054.1 hypothetical protein RFI_23314 [Reticulomyxa filosa]